MSKPESTYSEDTSYDIDDNIDIDMLTANDSDDSPPPKQNTLCNSFCCILSSLLTLVSLGFLGWQIYELTIKPIDRDELDKGAVEFWKKYWLKEYNRDKHKKNCKELGVKDYLEDCDKSTSTLSTTVSNNAISYYILFTIQDPVPACQSTPDEIEASIKEHTKALRFTKLQHWMYGDPFSLLLEKSSTKQDERDMSFNLLIDSLTSNFTAIEKRSEKITKLKGGKNDSQMPCKWKLEVFVKLVNGVKDFIKEKKGEMDEVVRTDEGKKKSWTEETGKKYEELIKIMEKVVMEYKKMVKKWT